MKSTGIVKPIVTILILGVVVWFFVPRLYLLSQWENVPLAFIDESVIIDGRLNETCWNLKKRPFHLVDQEGFEVDNVPAFQFHQDSSSLYFAASYKFPEQIELDSLNVGDLSLQLKLRPQKDGSHYKFRVLMEPLDLQGGFEGRMWCDCPKYVRYYDSTITNCSQVSRLDSMGWAVEFSIPLSEIIHKDDNRLSHELGFYSSIGGKETRATYPFPYDDPNKRRFFKIKH